jgi:hypothetical protein
MEMCGQNFIGYRPPSTKQIHEPLVDAVCHLIVEIPDIDPLGDVLGEWPVGDDPMKQFFFNSVHSATIETKEHPGNRYRVLPFQSDRKMFPIR